MTLIDRRSVFKLLSGMAAAEAIPPVHAVERLRITERDVVLLRFKRILSAHEKEILRREWSAQFPGTRLIVLDDGAELEILRTGGD